MNRKRKKTLWLLLAAALLVSGCVPTAANTSSGASSSTSSQTPISVASEEIAGSSSALSEERPSSVDQTSSEEQQSSSVEQSSSEEQSSSDSSEAPKPFTGGQVTFYSINDFHGAVKQNLSNSEPGILALGTFLKEKGEQENTVLINSGDMFQGAIESNLNRGKLLTDCMNEIEFDCFTLGNHEFDWGQEAIRLNHERRAVSDGYQTPWLCANIFDYDNELDEPGQTQQSSLGRLYTIKQLENGLSVGIIGVIGSDQWTSITSQLVDDIVFNDPVPYIKTISDELRTEKGCDLVVASVHSGQETVLETGITDVSPVSHEKYVDAVFCAHTHRCEDAQENGVVFTQNEAYGHNLSKLVLSIDAEKNVAASNLTTISYSQVVQEIGGSYDENLLSLVNRYATESDPIAEEVLGRLSTNQMSRYSAFPNMLADSMLQQAKKEGFSPALAMVNSARKNLYRGEITYGALFECIPFDNEVYLIECDGKDILNEAAYDSNLIARETEEAILEGSKYQIAVIDYLALHKSVYRRYNYFPSLRILGKLEAGNYRDILAAYIREKGSINGNDYSPTLWKYDCDALGDALS